MKSAEIHFLTDEIINKIAAGEVIERPASAVKELIENSIDAGATRIQVQIEQGGKKKILVSDNGKGMGKADLDLCYLRHTTSKLFAAEDLFHLHTNGFRGEAVASIAAVSKMTITSATDQGESNRIVLHGGNVVEKEGVAASRGTTFLIEDLFYNTPVRRTFLGSEVAEASKILDIVLKIALAHPEIRIDYKVGEKSVLVDFSDPNSVKQLSALNFTPLPGFKRQRWSNVADFNDRVACPLEIDNPTSSVPNSQYISHWISTEPAYRLQIISIDYRMRISGCLPIMHL